MDPFTRLTAAFPRAEVSPHTEAAYLESLADMPGSLLEYVVNQIIATSQWFPTVAEIRTAAARQLLQLPSVPEALTQIEQRCAAARNQPAPWPRLHPVVKATLDHVGGTYTWRNSENQTVLRGQFINLYREECAERLRAATHSDLGALALGENTSSGRELPPGGTPA